MRKPRLTGAPDRRWARVAAGYATWRLQQRGILGWKALAPFLVPSAATAFAGGLLILAGAAYSIVTGVVLIAAAVLTVSGWTSARGAAAISPPFILCNSIVGLVGVWLAGQKVATSTPLYALGVFIGAIAGVSIGVRWMSERATRAVLAAYFSSRACS